VRLAGVAVLVDVALQVRLVEAELAADLHEVELGILHEAPEVANRCAEVLSGSPDVYELWKLQLLNQ